ncbi:MAG: aldose 1-epimerase [Sphingobacteriales bacterium]|jgi:aldose 1-epimerase|nr:aldose 1-epimerase [Sphingobacteriales bacterium]MBP9140564.1 aldose 1-epimerase [Chitinophagales bacterium]MDA0197256.1 aldose 1-epimerase [Bacteroidota bacterium]MBK6890366.1 aldose 1-epimerase [Sphingobacteriales bacterium]MBK7526581.1 aldose 1-epimerase [Sphingobacteriales bacterium]
MFKVNKALFGQATQLVAEHSNNGIKLVVTPDYGGNFTQLWLPIDGHLLNVLDGCGTADEMATNELAKGILMAPFANRINNGQYVCNGIMHQLPVNSSVQGHAIHGFAHSLPFNVTGTKATQDFAELHLKAAYGTGNYQGYPYPFNMRLSYKITKQGYFILSTNIQGMDYEVEMPVQFGWHPYFSLGVPVDELLLQLPPVRRLGVNDRLIPNKQLETFTHFNEPQPLLDWNFDTGFAFVESGATNTIRLLKPNGWGLEIGCSEFYPFVQIYIPEHRQSIAIEPMTGTTDCFNNGMGLIELYHRESYSAAFTVKPIFTSIEALRANPNGQQTTADFRAPTNAKLY